MMEALSPHPSLSPLSGARELPSPQPSPRKRREGKCIDPGVQAGLGRRARRHGLI